MADRQVRYFFRNKQVSGATNLPSDAFISEPFIDAYEGKFYFKGVLGGNYVPVYGYGDFFEVGSNLSNLNVESGITTTYIDFRTGKTTNPFAVAGRVFFDEIENALTYHPLTNNMDVGINIGQEEIIFVYNNTGSDILNGQAVAIINSISDYRSGTPIVCLANASDITGNTAFISGVATHQIANGEYGIITNFGIVRGLNLSAFSNGDVVYLSDIEDGGYIKSENLLNSSRKCKIGRVVSNDSINGKLLISIENEIGNIYGLSERQETIFTINNASTGVILFDGLSVSGTSFSIGQAKGWIVDNFHDACYPSVLPIYYSGATGLTSIYLSGYDGTYLMINSASTLTMQPTLPTAEQRRKNLYLGKVTHPNKTTFTAYQHQLVANLSPYQNVFDMFASLKFIKDGLICNPNGVNLNFNISAGKLYGLGINFPSDSDIPNEISYLAQTPVTFRYRTQTGGSASDTTLIDPTSYDVGGVVTTIPGSVNRTTNQRIYLFPGGEIRIGYGQQYYGSLVEAIAGIQTEVFIEYSNFAENAILIGILSVSKGCVDLSDTTKARFIRTSRFGENLGGVAGISTATLQTAYNNSTNPEIITNSTLDGVQFRGGTGSDSDKNIIIENNAGTETGWIKADGSFSGRSFDGGVLMSGGTNLYDIFSTGTSSGTTDITRIQPGLNTYTGGTDNYPTVNISAATLNYLKIGNYDSVDKVATGNTNNDYIATKGYVDDNGGGINIIFSSSTLYSSGWTLNGTYYYQTLIISGITAVNNIDVGAASTYDDINNYSYSRIICSAQTTNQLTFAAVYQPGSNINVNVKVYDI